MARSTLGPADGGHPCPASWGAGVRVSLAARLTTDLPPKLSPHGGWATRGLHLLRSGSHRWVKGFCSLGRGSRTGS